MDKDSKIIKFNLSIRIKNIEHYISNIIDKIEFFVNRFNYYFKSQPIFNYSKYELYLNRLIILRIAPHALLVESCTYTILVTVLLGISGYLHWLPAGNSNYFGYTLCSLTSC